MTRGTGGQRFQVSELLKLSTWLIFLKFQLSSLGSGKGQRFIASGSYLSQTLAVVYCNGEQGRKEALPDGFGVGL